MTFISVAEAATHLGINVKTLHRWLADAHLCLQSHPHDGRKKGISDQQLLLLASQHHRSTPSLPSEPPALPDALLTLPEQITGLQTQIAA
ncbi:hypothetical protein [Tengunoibacter tsumagoiensis]|uniref:Uncharacterized protein n=1 Tax=Tengunoibacter tsumagoiensis TaxID=2014871 RepID=A0A402A7D2_9CHLR|nr:hypothetical protein [Tengunoibacter tsumagoiensis]GCE15028.1 hypothetical protein KTT_48870 [Tengunoibacter tsumagoiensis]